MTDDLVRMHGYRIGKKLDGMPCAVCGKTANSEFFVVIEGSIIFAHVACIANRSNEVLELEGLELPLSHQKTGLQCSICRKVLDEGYFLIYGNHMFFMHHDCIKDYEPVNVGNATFWRKGEPTKYGP